jgi:DHA1 family bicyclomycin/chloramphenicol resistance-like MFS transporter
MTKSAPAPTAASIALLASLTAIIPLAIDGMLPAFPEIGRAFELDSADQLQWIIAVLFLGFGFGQVLFGPISDVIGRKKPIYLGIFIFILGAVLSGLAPNFELFLLGRFLQGFGGSAPRIISLALIRDEYSGNAMARVTSLVMTIFILMPAIAPSLGQFVLIFAGWREIFILLFVFGTIVLFWFARSQKETLPVEKRKKMTWQYIGYGLKETFSHSTTLVSMIVSGMVFGIFVGYLGAVQEIFAEIFHSADRFPIYFALLALSIGAASFFNSKLVMLFGMRRLIVYAFIFMAILSNAFSFYLSLQDFLNPPLWLFMSYMILTFFSVGFLFGNLNALAMQPLGHVAGMGSAILGFVQSSLSVVIGVYLGQFFHESILPLVISFGTISIICIVIFGIEHSIKSKKKFINV